MLIRTDRGSIDVRPLSAAMPYSPGRFFDMMFTWMSKKGKRRIWCSIDIVNRNATKDKDKFNPSIDESFSLNNVPQQDQSSHDWIDIGSDQQRSGEHTGHWRSHSCRIQLDREITSVFRILRNNCSSQWSTRSTMGPSPFDTRRNSRSSSLNLSRPINWLSSTMSNSPARTKKNSSRLKSSTAVRRVLISLSFIHPHPLSSLNSSIEWSKHYKSERSSLVDIWQFLSFFPDLFKQCDAFFIAANTLMTLWTRNVWRMFDRTSKHRSHSLFVCSFGTNRIDSRTKKCWRIFRSRHLIDQLMEWDKQWSKRIVHLYCPNKIPIDWNDHRDDRWAFSQVWRMIAVLKRMTSIVSCSPSNDVFLGRNSLECFVIVFCFSQKWTVRGSDGARSNHWKRNWSYFSDFVCWRGSTMNKEFNVLFLSSIHSSVNQCVRGKILRSPTNNGTSIIRSQERNHRIVLRDIENVSDFCHWMKSSASSPSSRIGRRWWRSSPNKIDYFDSTKLIRAQHLW